MRIQHLITTLGVGGAEKHLLLLTAGQVARGHEVFVTYFKGDGELTDDFERVGVTVSALPMGAVSSLPRTRKQLVALLAERRPDVVHTHLLKADALGAMAVPKLGPDAPVLIASKHNDERALLRWPVSVVHGLLSKRVARTIALSKHVERFVVRHGRVPADRITQIYYGIDPTSMRPTRPRDDVRAELDLPADARVLVCVGRLAPQKDHPTLLRAMTQLPDDVVLLLVGGDPFGQGEQRLRALADELRLGDRVRFVGIRSDVPDLLGASDLFVLPSLWEGLGLVFLEAMAASVPIVATTVSAIPEVVEDGESGWLVEPSDPDALAGAIGAALDDPDERRRRGEAGAARLADRFGLARMIDETLAVYEAELR